MTEASINAIFMQTATPTLADWLQGWGTVVGSSFSAVAAIAALALYWREVKYRNHDAEEITALQAQGVLVTIETPSRPQRLDSIELIAHNFSDQVILSLYVRLYRRDFRQEVTWLSSDVFPPGGRWVRQITLDPVMICDRPEHPPELFEFHIWFTDARGRNWHRVDRQQPVRITSSPAVEWAAHPDRYGR
jgi:hypothetical protein